MFGLWVFLVAGIDLFLAIKLFLVFLLGQLPRAQLIHQVLIKRPPPQTHQINILNRYILLIQQ